MTKRKKALIKVLRADIELNKRQLGDVSMKEGLIVFHRILVNLLELIERETA